MRATSSGFLVVLLLVAMDAGAETRQLASTIYTVTVEQPTTGDLRDGTSFSRGGLIQGQILGDDGLHWSQWCRNSTAAKEGRLVGGGGFCTTFTETGDMIWIWLRSVSNASLEWGVIGGTGQYQGATGSGKSEQTKTLADGTEVWRSSGTITTP